MDAASLTQKLISIPSFFPKEEKIALFIKSYVQKNIKCKVEVQKVEGKRFNLLFTKGTSKKSILLSAHLDSVPVVEGWNGKEFKPLVKGDRLYGLGSWDMKSGIAILIKVLEEFEPKNFKLKVALTIDEENYSIGVHKLIGSGFCSDVDFVMVPEPGFVHGEHGIAIGRSGRATYTVKIKGISSHGSFPEEGLNAIEQASVFINSIIGLKLSSNPELGSSVVFPRFISSEAKGFSIPDVCHLEIDSKLISPDEPEIILKKLRDHAKKLFDSKKMKFLPEISFKDRPTPFCSPYEVDKNNKFVKICEKGVEEVTGKAVLFYRNSVADECIFAKILKVPVVTIGPSGDQAHKSQEYVSLKSIERVKRSYLTILGKLDSIS